MDDHDEYPEITQEDINRAVLRVNMKPVEKKQRITILLDSTVVNYFKIKAGSRGYQTLINEVLKKNIEHENLEAILRKVIREEMSKGRMVG